MKRPVLSYHLHGLCRVTPQNKSVLLFEPGDPRTLAVLTGSRCRQKLLLKAAYIYVRNITSSYNVVFFTVCFSFTIQNDIDNKGDLYLFKVYTLST
jgi:hypothetical protein